MKVGLDKGKKNTAWCPFLNQGGTVVRIMGILNVTPDSFSDGGNFIDIDKAVAHAKKMIADGVDIIDIGGESTRPGATVVTAEKELLRVIPVIKAIRKFSSIPISIDTYKAEVARLAVAAGATIINDVGGAKLDPDMPKVMAESGAKIILMHNRPHGEEVDCFDILKQVKEELQSSIDLVLTAGVKPENIVIDPGIGFGKTLQQNIELIRSIDQLQNLGYPVLLAASRKRVIRALVQSDDLVAIEQGTVAVSCFAYAKGVQMVRVHDVAANKMALNVLVGLKEGI